MIKDMLSDIFSPFSSFGEKCMSALMMLLMILVAGLLGWLIFILVNSVGITPTKTAITVVESKQVVPAHTTTMFVMSGKVMVPITTYHPESYKLHFKIDVKDLESTVEKEFFDSVKTDEKIEVDYGFGRLNGSYEPVRIRFAHNK